MCTIGHSSFSRKFHNKSWLLAAKPPKAVPPLLGDEMQFLQQRQEQQKLEQLLH